MSRNIICIPFYMGTTIAMTISGCMFVSGEDCSYQDYCRGDLLYAAEGPAEWSNDCIEYILEDCAETGSVCQEYKDGAVCLYPEISCNPGVQALCDGDFVYRCDSNTNAAVERESCAETGRVCREYTDGTGDTAGCFYEGIICESRSEATAMNDVCDDNFAYVCDPDADMAFKRTDCRETGEMCVQVEGWGAVCTIACTEEGERKCNPSSTIIIRCINGGWIPEEYCEYGSLCEAVEQEGVTEPHCVQES